MANGRSRSWMRAAVALVGLALLGTAAAALAQSYPTKPVRLVTGFAAGGAADAMARIMALKMTEGLGQQVLVENRTGAAGLIANEFVARSAPDGYTLLLVTSALPMQAAMLKKLPYDPVRDFAPISVLMRYPFVLIVSLESPFKTLPEFIAHARANPNRLSYGSSGIGGGHHLATELFNARAGTDMVHVPFRGGTAMVTELISGRIQLVFEVLPNALPFIKGGKIRPLAVASTSPSPFLPDVPLMAQALPGYEVGSFFGLAGAAGMPAALTAQLNAEVRRVLALPDVRQRFLDLGGEATPSTPEEMRQSIEKEIEKWTQVVAQRKIERQ